MQIFNKQFNLSRILAQTLFLILVFVFFGRVFPRFLDTLLTKAEEEKAWRQERLSQYYGEDIEEQNNSKRIMVSYNMEGKCIRNCGRNSNSKK